MSGASVSWWGMLCGSGAPGNHITDESLLGPHVAVNSPNKLDQVEDLNKYIIVHLDNKERPRVLPPLAADAFRVVKPLQANKMLQAQGIERVNKVGLQDVAVLHRFGDDHGLMGGIVHVRYALPPQLVGRIVVEATPLI